MVNTEPMMSASGRLRLAFLSSAFIEVASIQPSYANAKPTIALKKPSPLTGVYSGVLT